MKRKPFDEEELFHYLMTEEERVAKLSLKELEKYMQRAEAMDEFLWPGEKHESCGRGRSTNIPSGCSNCWRRKSKRPEHSRTIPPKA